MAQNATMQLEDWLDDLCVRFIINLPEEDLSTVARICFQIEEAQWFYEDFIRPLDPTLPSMTLRNFCLRMFQHCPLLAHFSDESHATAFEEFLQYKTRVPVRGAIMLNEAMDSTVLVKGWKKNANWSFPRGKINKDEDDLDCAIREVYEETGFDIRAAGRVPQNEDIKYIEISMREQTVRLYVFRNIPMDTYFEPKTRKEISKIEWYKLSDLPAFRKKGGDKNSQNQNLSKAANANKFYMVAPFLVPLKKWVVQQKKKDAQKAARSYHLTTHAFQDDPLTEEDAGVQTETGPEPPIEIPSARKIEDATRELHRLLQLEQSSRASSQARKQPSPGPGQDRGEALMALLQAKGGSQQPHTPLEHIVASAPQPFTPHHHQEPAMNLVSAHQPPPAFPIPPNVHHNYSAANFHYPQAPLPQGLMNHAHNVTNLPQHYHHDSIPLVHPQPLPPQVQREALMRGMFTSPSVPDQGGMLHPQSKAAAPLNAHTLGLLNQFKQGGSAAGVPQPAPAALQKQALELAPEMTGHSASQLLAQDQTNTAVFGQQGLALEHATPPTMARQPLARDDKHRSSLLSMFTKSGHTPAAAIPVGRDSGHDRAMASPSNMQSAHRAVPQMTSNAEAISSAAHANGGPLQMNPETNLPFGALSILSRPKDSEAKQQAYSQSLSSLPAKQPGATTADIQARAESSHAVQAKTDLAALLAKSSGPSFTKTFYDNSPAPSAFPAPAILDRRNDTQPEQRQKLLSLFAKDSAAAAVAHHEDKGKQPAAPTNQGFNLLSLLNQQPPQAPSHARRPSYGSVASAGLPAKQVPRPAPNPRQGEVAPSMARQDSQTPISPADRTFLLGMLEQVSSTTRR